MCECEKEQVGFLKLFLAQPKVNITKNEHNIVDFNMTEVNTGDLVKMNYDGCRLKVQYFRDDKALGSPYEHFCPDILAVIVEIMYAIDYNKDLGQTFKTLA